MRPNIGWRNDSARHSLARRGIKTGKSDGSAYSMFNKSKSPHDHALLAAGQKQDVHHYLYKLTETKKEDNPEHVKQLEKAQEEVKHITTVGKLKEWFFRYRHVLEAVGVTGLLFGLSALAGGAGGLFMNTATGEIVHLGGTALGQAATTAGVAVGGFGLGEGAREALIAAQEAKIEEKMRKAESPKEFERLKKEEEALEESEKLLGRKSGDIPVYEEGLEAKGRSAEQKEYAEKFGEFGSVKWQNTMEKVVRHKVLGGEELSPQERAFVDIQKQKYGVK